MRVFCGYLVTMILFVIMTVILRMIIAKLEKKDLVRILIKSIIFCTVGYWLGVLLERI